MHIELLVSDTEVLLRLDNDPNVLSLSPAEFQLGGDTTVNQPDMRQLTVKIGAGASFQTVRTILRHILPRLGVRTHLVLYSGNDEVLAACQSGTALATSVMSLEIQDASAGALDVFSFPYLETLTITAERASYLPPIRTMAQLTHLCIKGNGDQQDKVAWLQKLPSLRTFHCEGTFTTPLILGANLSPFLLDLRCRQLDLQRLGAGYAPYRLKHLQGVRDLPGPEQNVIRRDDALALGVLMQRAHFEVIFELCPHLQSLEVRLHEPVVLTQTWSAAASACTSLTIICSDTVTVEALPVNLQEGIICAPEVNGPDMGRVRYILFSP